MSNNAILTASVMTVILLGFYGTSDAAFAQYYGNVGEHGETGQHKPIVVDGQHGTVSETSYLDLEGVVGASIIVGAVFGGIAGAFFLRSRSGKYAAMGQG